MSRHILVGIAVWLTLLSAGSWADPQPLTSASPSEERASALPPHGNSEIQPLPEAFTSRETEADSGKPVVRQAPDYENSVYFGLGKTEVNADGLNTLNKHASRLKEDTDLIVTLIGHTDHLGSRSYNQAICEERLDSVVEVLQSLGVHKRQIRRIALGNEKINSRGCDSEACHQAMRRVDLVYQPSSRR